MTIKVADRCLTEKPWAYQIATDFTVNAMSQERELGLRVLAYTDVPDREMSRCVIDTADGPVMVTFQNLRAVEGA